MPGQFLTEINNRGHFAVQWDGLSNRSAGAVEQFLLSVGGQGGILAWQANQRLGPQGGSGCSSGGNAFVPYTEAEYSNLLANGVSLQGRWLEVWAPNVLAFPGAIQQAHLGHR